MRKTFAAVVIGASAGGVAALQMLVAALPASWALPLVIVLHVPERGPNVLASILAQRGHVPVREAEDKERIRDGTVYLAPPGYHLLVESDGHFALSVDDRVNFSRPSIDLLFESASAYYGADLLGILLTGANEDGADGLRVIRERGGTTLVQDPKTAEASAMPQAALDRGAPDGVWRLEQIAQFLSGLEGRAKAKELG